MMKKIIINILKELGLYETVYVDVLKDYRIKMDNNYNYLDKIIMKKERWREGDVWIIVGFHWEKGYHSYYYKILFKDGSTELVHYYSIEPYLWEYHNELKLLEEIEKKKKEIEWATEVLKQMSQKIDKQKMAKLIELNWLIQDFNIKKK